MTISKFSENNRKEFIRSFEFFQCLTEVLNYLRTNYGQSKNTLILSLLQILGWCRDSEWNQIKNYGHLLTDYVFWQSREFYFEKLQDFVDGELDSPEFVAQVLYVILSDKNEALDLEEAFYQRKNINFYQKRNIDLDPKSFQFSEIILSLLLPLEGFDADPNESFFTEEELRKGVKLALKEIEKYFKD